MTLISSIFVLLFVALVAGELLNRVGIPSVVGELLTGLILGPAVLGVVKPNQVFSGISEIALFFIVLLIGIEATTDSLIKNYKPALVFTATSFIIPVMAMVLVSMMFFHLGYIGAIVLSVAIGVPSISIVSVILRDYEMLRIRAGHIILASVVITDIVAFAVASIFSDPKAIYYEIPGIAVFMVLFFTLDMEVRKHSGQVIRLFTRLHATERGEKIIFGSIILSGLIIASIFEIIGITYVLGAFFAGIIISDVVVGRELQGILTRTLSRINDSFFIPIFFAIAGLNSVFPPRYDIYLMLALVSVGVLISVPLDYFYGRTVFEHINARTGVGILGGRGAVGIVIATVALSSGIISRSLFSVAVFATLIISTGIPPLVRKKDIKIPEEASELLYY
jgi:Kef-type K+ transport system membrane component KefB